MTANDDGKALGIGLDTFLTRAEAWECDHNGHWNTRFYGEAFTEASDVVAALSQENSPAGPVNWMLRFHREILVGSVARVKSSAVSDGEFMAGLIHVLGSEGALSATAIMLPGTGCADLASSDPEILAQAVPRGLAGIVVDWRDVTEQAQCSVPLGLLRLADLDGQQRLRLKEMLRFSGRAAQAHREALGFGLKYTRETNIGAMLVELRVTLFAAPGLGRPLRMDSRLVEVGDRTYVSAHCIRTEDGLVLAQVEMCLLAVDMVARKAVRMPDFLKALAMGADVEG